MPAVATGGMAPDPEHDPFEMITALLLEWSDLPRERVAMMAKAAKPELTDVEVSQLVGVSLRRLRRWTSYARLAGNPTGFRDDLRSRGFSNPGAPDA